VSNAEYYEFGAKLQVMRAVQNAGITGREAKRAEASAIGTDRQVSSME